METSKQLLLRYAVKLAAALNHSYESLNEAVTNMLYNNTSERFSEEKINSQIEYDTCSHLFFDYGFEQPRRIKNVGIVKKSFSELWFLTYIARNCEQLTFLELKNLAAQKFVQEKTVDNKLTESKHSHWLLSTFRSTELIKKYGKGLCAVSHFAEEAMKNMCVFLRNTNYDKGFSEIYPLSELEMVKEKVSPVPKLEKKTSDTKHLENTIKSLRSDKLLLETKIHKMQVDMEHMKKDIIRDVLSDLTNPAYGYPLSELYLCSKDGQLSENVRGIIQNLFATLGNAGIKLLKTTALGEELVFDEDVSKKYEIYKYHEFKAGDKVYVCYPGYRFDRETIIKPTVKRKDV